MKKELLIAASVALTLGLSACSTTQNQAENSMTPVELKKSYAASKINVQLGLGYLQQGKRDRAKAKLLTALQQAPQSAQANDAMAYFLEVTGDSDKADKFYQQAIRLAPGKGAPLNNYGTYLCRNGKYREAEKYFSAAVKDANYLSSADAYENAGLCVLQLQDYAKAKSYFTMALKNDPKRPTSLLELGQISYRDKDYKGANQYLRKRSKLSTPTAESAWLTYRVAEKLGQRERALATGMLLKSKFSKSKEYRQFVASRGKKSV